MKKGFTLIELLCVIVIIGLILVLAIPSITNLINNEKDNISDSMKNLITQSGELYVQDNSGMYKKTEGNVYCITLRELIDAERLQDPLKDPITGDEIDTNKYVKVLVENGNYEYELSNSCTQVENTENEDTNIEEQKVCSVTQGTGSNIGDVITCGTESFYIYDTTGSNIKMLAMYNLEVGNEENSSYPTTIETNKQSSNAIGWNTQDIPTYATVAFSSDNKKGTNYSDYEGSIVEGYVDAYKVILENMGVNVVDISLITKDELEKLVNNGNSLSAESIKTRADALNRSWLYLTTYFSSSPNTTIDIWYINSNGELDGSYYYQDAYFGIRPTVTISKNDIAY